jgi:hypothetical protein
MNFGVTRVACLRNGKGNEAENRGDDHGENRGADDEAHGRPPDAHCGAPPFERTGFASPRRPIDRTVQLVLTHPNRTRR